jgi:hypothetical protein
MSTEALIAELEALPESERSKVFAYFADKSDDSWVPESFKKAMAEADAGKTYPLEDIMNGAPPPKE